MHMKVLIHDSTCEGRYRLELLVPKTDGPMRERNDIPSNFIICQLAKFRQTHKFKLTRCSAHASVLKRLVTGGLSALQSLPLCSTHVQTGVHEVEHGPTRHAKTASVSSKTWHLSECKSTFAIP